MLDSLNVYLQTSTTPELRAAITEAFELFDEYGLDDPDVGFEDILMTADNEGASDATIRIVALTEQLQNSILDQMQIKLSDEAMVSDGNTILRALKQLESTELNDEIVGICRETNDPIEALGEVLNLVTGIEPERLMCLFDEVGQSTIKKIQAMASQHVGERRDIIDTQKNAELMNKFLAYRAAMDDQPLFMYDMLIAGVPLNQPYSVYHGKIMSAITAQELESPMPVRLRQIKTAVQLCAAIVIACDTQDANMRNVVMAELEKTFSDVDTITPIYVEIDSIMRKFQALLTSGMGKVTNEKA